jgi:hypothetical protein
MLQFARRRPQTNEKTVDRQEKLITVCKQYSQVSKSNVLGRATLSFLPFNLSILNPKATCKFKYWEFLFFFFRKNTEG